MYNNSTADARTDLYGIGKGAAQIIDTTQTQENILQKKKEDFAAKQAKAKEQADTEADVMSNLSKMGSIEIMPKDQQMFAEKAQGIRDFVNKNHDKLRNGDIGATLEFQRLYGDYNTNAEMSKNYREKWEANGQMIAKDPAAYREGVMEEHLKRASTADAGNWNDDPSVYKQNINYNDRVLKVLAPNAQAMAQDTPYRKTFTIDQANKSIEDDLKDAQLFEQASYDFNKAADKLGTKDPIEYYKKIYAPKLVVSDTKAGPQASGSGNATTRPRVSAVVTEAPNGDKTASFNFTDKPENPKLKVDNPDIPNQTMDITPMAIVKTKGGKIMLKGSVTEKDAGGNPIQKIKLVDYSTVADVMTNSFGIENPTALLEGNAPEHVTVKKYNLKNEGKTVVNTGVLNGKKVVKYSDGTIEYQ
jgi:hypothetical protein